MTTPATSPSTGPVTNPVTFTAHDPGDLLALVPSVLGFHPEDSLVLLSLGAAGGGMSARVDLPHDEASRETVAGLLRDACVRNGSARVALVAYTAVHAASEASAAALRCAAARLEGSGVEVAVAVRADGRCWYAVPELGDESAGTPYDLDSHPLTAETVFRGRVVAGSRQALAASLDPLDDPDDARALARSAHVVAGAMTTAQGSPTAEDVWWPQEARWLRDRVRRHLADPEPLTAADAGRFVVDLASIHLRDVAWAEMTRENAPRHVTLWRDLLRRAPVEDAAPSASLLAFAAWLAGDGALAWCALDRALAADPDYSMAGLLAQLLEAAVPPTGWTPVASSDLPVWGGEPPPTAR